MSEEVLEKICSMDRRNAELQIVMQCAPTIAGLKTSNLLIVNKDDEYDVSAVLRRTGLKYFRLVYDRQRVVFLVFNRDLLNAYLSQDDVKQLLHGYGYKSDSLGYILRTFQTRYDLFINKKAQFPHEMGLILGYPVDDVVGFITNEGRNFLLEGYWKVYSNLHEAKALFERFDGEKDNMIMLIFEGKHIDQIVDTYKRENSLLLTEAV